MMLLRLFGIWTMAALLPATFAFAAIPRSTFIISKLAEHGGAGSYAIDQDVTFSSTNGTLVLREQWLVTPDGLRLTVKANRENGEQVRIQAVYGGGQKTVLAARGKQTTSLNEDFLERYFHTRSRDAYFALLNQMKILPLTYLGAHATRTGKDFIYPPEPLVRLARVGGVVTYGLGEPSGSEGELKPGLWVEQDVFHLRKIRTPSGVTVAADQYITYARDLALPRERRVTWGDRANPSSATIQIAKVTGLTMAKGDKRVQPSSLEFSSQISGISDPELLKQVEEFYLRFR